MKNQGNMTPPKVHSSLITNSKNIKMDEMSSREFKGLVLKMISDLNKDSNKQANEEKESFQDSEDKYSHSDDKFKDLDERTAKR
jgi:hypothetical protein